MSILVTGGTGFLGTHLCRRLKDEGHTVVISNTKFCNLLDYDNLKNIPQKFDYIFHLAAFAKGGDFCLSHTGEYWEINQRINTNIMQYWKDFQPQAKFVTMGTSCSYGAGVERTPDNYFVNEPEESLYIYAYAKRMLYLGLEGFAKQYGLEYLYFVPPTLYGEDFREGDSHFIFDLIRKICAAKYDNKGPVTLWGDGNQRRELIYIGDAVDLMLSKLEEKNQFYNLGSNTDYSITDYARIICEFVGYDFNLIKYDTTRYVGMLDNLLVSHNPDYKFTNIYNGLEKTIKYYKQIKEEKLCQ